MILHKVKGGIRSQQIPPSDHAKTQIEDGSYIVAHPHEKVNSNEEVL